VLVCGDKGTTTLDGEPFLTWFVVTKSTDALNFQKRWDYLTSADAKRSYCSGIYSDGRHAYMLLQTNYYNNRFQPVVVFKDLIYGTDDHAKTVPLNSGYLDVDSFVVKTESGIKTLFMGGTSTSQLLGLSTSSKVNFILKFNVDLVDATILSSPFMCTNFDDKDADETGGVLL